jgi:hypothetical protein
VTEQEFQRMLDRAQAKKLEQQELAKTHATRRQTLLQRAIQTNRVTVEGATITGDEDLRTFFDQDMARRLRTANITDRDADQDQ